MKTTALMILMVSLPYAQQRATQTTDTTVFGFRLGQILSISECPYDKAQHDLEGKTTVDAFYNFGPFKKTCFEHLDDVTTGDWIGKPLETEVVIINFAEDQTLSIAGPHITAHVIGGRLEGIVIYTVGYSAQSAALNLLKGKYGDPTTVSTTSEQNAFGARYKNIHAKWRRGDINVVFDGMIDKIDEGRIIINTKKGAEFLARIRTQGQNSPKL